MQLVGAFTGVQFRVVPELVVPDAANPVGALAVVVQLLPLPSVPEGSGLRAIRGTVDHRQRAASRVARIGGLCGSQGIVDIREIEGILRGVLSEAWTRL